MLALKKVFGISKDNSKLDYNIFQVLEKREKKEWKRYKEALPARCKSANLVPITISTVAAPWHLEKRQYTEILDKTTDASGVRNSSKLESRRPIPAKRRALRLTGEEIPKRQSLSRANLPPPPLPPTRRRSCYGTVSRERLPPPPPPPPTKAVQAPSSETNVTAELRAEIAERDRRLAEVQRTISELKANVAGKTQQLDECERTVSEKTEELSMSVRIVAQVNAEMEEKTRLLIEARRLIAKLKDEDAVKTSRLAETRRNNEILMIEVAEKTRLLADARQSYERAMTEKNEAPRIIAELRADIAEQNQRLAEAERTIETHGAFCSICLTEVANRMWSGCNHLAACRECAQTLDNSIVAGDNRSENGIACPKCRTHGRLLPVFI